MRKQNPLILCAIAALFGLQTFGIWFLASEVGEMQREVMRLRRPAPGLPASITIYVNRPQETGQVVKSFAQEIGLPGWPKKGNK